MNAVRYSGIPRTAHAVTGPSSDSDNVLTGVTAIAGIAATIVGILLVIVGPGHWPGLLGAFLIACVPPGAAVMCWLDSGLGVVQAGLTLVLSLAVTAVTSTVMIWVSSWHPKMLLVLSLLSSISCIARLWRNGVPSVEQAESTHGQRSWLWMAVLLAFGLAAWAYGASHIQRDSIGLYGVLASANIWLVIGFVALLGGGLIELMRRTPRTWLLCAYIAALIVAIYATVPIVFVVPEYSWVYKHIGVAQALGNSGRITDPSDIYQQWPALFTTVASVSGLSHMESLRFAAWAPLAFELADALLLLGIFRLLAINRRAAYLALFLFEGFIAWIGQDYLSPQAFGYLLWLGIATIILRWLLTPGHGAGYGMMSRLRARMLTRIPPPDDASLVERRIATALVVAIFFAITAAHQLTPYMALASIGALVVVGLVWRGWLLMAALSIVAGAYLLPRTGVLAQFGGLFHGGDALQNASGVQGVKSQGAEAFTAAFAHLLAMLMWLPALGVILRNWRSLGRVAIPALLGFSPFAVIAVQNYGGEAIYRVYLFSAPWCALLIASAIMGLRPTKWRSVLTPLLCTILLAAGLQGSYGLVGVDGMTPAELSASLWLYKNSPPGSLLVLPVDSFPDLEVANYNDYNLEVIPAIPVAKRFLSEADVPHVEQWLGSLGHRTAYVVFSHSMSAFASYFGGPQGYPQMERAVAHRAGWSVIYRNADTVIYLVHLNKSSAAS